MSYEVTFIKNRVNLSLKNIGHILEDTDAKETDFDFFPLKFRESLISVLKDEGLEFDVFKSGKEVTGSYFELNFPTYQVYFFDTQISIVVPYWDENTSKKIDNEIKIISNVLLVNDLVGYDSQTDEIITEQYSLDSNFITSKSVVDNSHDKKCNNHTSYNFHWWILGVFVFAIILIKAIKFFRTDT